MTRAVIAAAMAALFVGAGGHLSPALADSTTFVDARDFSGSKAKSSIRQVRKRFGDLDEAINENTRQLGNDSFYERRVGEIEKHFEKIADKDPSWDLSKERAHLASIKRRWAVAVAAQKKAKVESSEPDLGDMAASAFEGAPTMKPVVPDWCDAAAFKPEDSWIGSRTYKQMVDTLGEDEIIRAAEHACRAPKFAKRQQWSAAWRQAIANKTGASAALISRYYQVMMKERAGAGLKAATCGGEAPSSKGGKRGRSRAGRRGGGSSSAGVRAAPSDDSAFAEARQYAIGCKVSPVTMDTGDLHISNFAWTYDRGPGAPDELTRAVFILSQIALDISESDRVRGSDWESAALKKLGAYALVSTDVKRLDEAKFRRELAAMHLNEYGTVMAELTFSKAVFWGKVYERAYKRMDPGIAELAFGVPVAAFAAWEKQHAVYKDAMAIAADIEDKHLTGRHTEIRGCHDKAHAAFAKYVASAAKGAKTNDDKQAVMSDAIAYTLLQTSMVCAAFEGNYTVASALYRAGLDNKREWRGPRIAGYWATMERFTEIKEKDSGFPLTDRELGLWVTQPSPDLKYKAYEQTYNKLGVVEVKTGRVKSVSKTKGGVKLTFVTESWKERVWDCKETRKVDRIKSDGTIVYRQKCTAKGHRTVKSTVKPYVVPTSLAGGIAKGMFVKASVDQKSTGNVGVPLEIYKSKKQDKLIGALGVMF